MNLEQISRLTTALIRGPRAVGPVVTARWVAGLAQSYLPNTTPQIRSLHVGSINHPLQLRTKNSDFGVFRQIMIEREYKPLEDLNIATVLDLGANIGVASAWFLSHFPRAQVFAVEPAEDNYEICCRNLAPYGKRARVLHGAAWSRHTTLTIHPRTCAADNQVKENSTDPSVPCQVEGWDVASLIAMSDFPQIDLLKMDIEGAESEIFSADISTWIGRVRNICIELHGEACRETFFRALADYEFGLRVSGELDICTNLRANSAAA